MDPRYFLLICIFISANSLISCERKDEPSSGDGPNDNSTGTADTTPPTTTADYLSGMYSVPIVVSLSINEPSTIYFSLNSADPENAFTVYQSSIPINQSTSLRFYSKDLAGNTEATKSLNITITLPNLDFDNDGMANTLDNCPNISNIDQKDIDRNNVGDACDPNYLAQIDMLLND